MHLTRYERIIITAKVDLEHKRHVQGFTACK